MTPLSDLPVLPTPRRTGVRSRLAAARRRAALVTSAALLATGVAVGSAHVGANQTDAPAVSVPAPHVPAPLTPRVVTVSHVQAEPEADEPADEGGAAEGEVVGAGKASYYGAELAGNPTASGEAFDPAEMTAAHRTLPFGTRVRVTNERNGESVVVRVNDRGPFHGDRVIDVSTAAAKEIGLKRSGTAPVTLERLPKKPVRG